MIYIHVPFCRSFCTYCGFYSEVPSGQAGWAGQYAEAVCREISSRREEISVAGAPATLYIGGGTPSVLPLSALESILRALESAGTGPHWKEFTVEVNPDDIVSRGREYVESLLRAGVTRISMGVQSLDDRVLGWMRRRHDAASAVRAYSILREAGVPDISVDLMFGISFMDDGVWETSLRKVLSGFGTGAAPEHISAYQLSIDPESTLAAMADGGRYEEASDIMCAGQYRMLCDMLSEAGYHHYEISNFALPGHEAVHNSAYWRQVPYAGLGPGAHSLKIIPGQDGRPGKYVRSWNAPSLHRYLSAAGISDFTDLRGSETLDSRQVALERVMLSLRTDSGIDEDFLRRHSAPGAVDKAIAAGTLCRVPSVSDRPRIRIPEQCFFISDNIIAGLV